MNATFSPMLPSKVQHIKERARLKTGFGMADRFLYVKMAERLATCQPNLSPANYNHHNQFKKMHEYPCTTVLVSLKNFLGLIQFLVLQKTLNIAKEDQLNYKYIGQSLVYDPVKPIAPALDNTRLALPGNRGIFVHPNYKPRAGISTSRNRDFQTIDNCTKGRTRGRSIDFRGIDYGPLRGRTLPEGSAEREMFSQSTTNIAQTARPVSSYNDISHAMITTNKKTEHSTHKNVQIDEEPQAELASPRDNVAQDELDSAKPRIHERNNFMSPQMTFSESEIRNEYNTSKPTQDNTAHMYVTQENFAKKASKDTSITEIGQPTPRIMQENCARNVNSGSNLGQKHQTSTNIYMSPVSHEDEESRDVGTGLRTLPRLSESQAVHNFNEIHNDRQKGKGKYRHVSHADFHKSQDHGAMGKKRRDITSEAGGNAVEDSQNLLTSSNHDRSLQTPGFSTNPSKQRYGKVKARHDLQLEPTAESAFD